MEMPRTKDDLQEAFEEFLGSKNVYFRPPESAKMHYPCIKFDLRSGDSEYADNRTYIFRRSYNIQIIHKEAETDLVDRFAFAFPKCRFDRSFKVNNLVHDNFVLYT